MDSGFQLFIAPNVTRQGLDKKTRNEPGSHPNLAIPQGETILVAHAIFRATVAFRLPAKSKRFPPASWEVRAK